MTLEESYYAWAVANSAISALIGNRIYAVVIPEPALKTLPLQTYRRAARTVERDLAGEAVERITLELTAWHNEYAGVKEAANTAAEELVAFEGGVMGGGVVVEAVKFVTEEDMFLDDPFMFGVQQTFEFVVTH